MGPKGKVFIKINSSSIIILPLPLLLNLRLCFNHLVILRISRHYSRKGFCFILCWLAAQRFTFYEKKMTEWKVPFKRLAPGSQVEWTKSESMHRWEFVLEYASNVQGQKYVKTKLLYKNILLKMCIKNYGKTGIVKKTGAMNNVNTWYAKEHYKEGKNANFHWKNIKVRKQIWKIIKIL